MEMKHTPGPWKFPFNQLPETTTKITVLPENDPNNGIGWDFKTIYISDNDNNVLAEVKAFTCKGFINDFNQWEANAKLIAAAPAMYDAIQCALNIKDLWSADPQGTISADREGEMQALKLMQEKFEAIIKTLD